MAPRNASWALLCKSFPRLRVILHPSWLNYNLPLQSTQLLKSILDLADNLLSRSYHFPANSIWSFLQGCVSSTLDIEWFQSSVVIQQVRHRPGHECFRLSLWCKHLDFYSHQDLLWSVPIFVLFTKYSSSASCSEELLLEVWHQFWARSCWKKSRNFNLIVLLRNCLSSVCTITIPLRFPEAMSGWLLLLLLLLHLPATAKGNLGCGQRCRQSLVEHFLSTLAITLKMHSGSTGSCTITALDFVCQNCNTKSCAFFKFLQ